IATEISAEFLQTEAGQRMVNTLPRRRMGEPPDLDGLLLLLCSFAPSRFINGSVMVADDGWTSA
ncbi:MAG TPA: 2-deoxy-D-gluconate 3-dehydrogenase, partial [Acetobacteraceae bacterium]